MLRVGVVDNCGLAGPESEGSFSERGRELVDFGGEASGVIEL